MTVNNLFQGTGFSASTLVNIIRRQRRRIKKELVQKSYYHYNHNTKSQWDACMRLGPLRKIILSTVTAAASENIISTGTYLITSLYTLKTACRINPLPSFFCWCACQAHFFPGECTCVMVNTQGGAFGCTEKRP